MSFTKEIKKELIGKKTKKSSDKRRKNVERRCCQLAELSAFVTMAMSERDFVLKYEDKHLAQKVAAFIETLFGYTCDLNESLRGKTSEYELVFYDDEIRRKVFSTARIEGQKGVSLRATCCKRAYIRGMLIACGTISNPKISYNFECIFKNEFLANELQKLLEAFEISARIIGRKKYYVVYLKDGEQIAKLLSVVGASRGLLEFEQMRVLKEYRNRLNRQVNCETANSNKAVKASVAQVQDLELIVEVYGLGYLDESLAELARLRMDDPYASMAQLGERLDTKLSKSGVNHRFKKIRELADKIRKEKNQERN